MGMSNRCTNVQLGRSKIEVIGRQ